MIAESGRVSDGVQQVKRLRGFHYESVADAIIGLENHHRAGFLVRQPDGAALDAVFDDLAGLEDREHIANRQAVVGAAIDDDNLVLADLGNATDDRDDAPFNLRCSVSAGRS